MSALRLSLTFFLCALALPAVSFAQDTVIMVGEDGAEGTKHYGKISYVNLDKSTVTLQFVDGSLAFFRFDEIADIIATDTKVLNRWATVEKQRTGTPEDYDGGRRGIRDIGDPMEQEEIVPTDREVEEIEALLAKLASGEKVEDEIFAYRGKATTQLINALSHQSDTLRAAACRILGRTKARRSIEALIERIDDSYDGVRGEAVQALAAIAPEEPAVYNALVARAKVEPVIHVMKAIMIALGPVASSLPGLKQQIIRDSYDARASMAVYYYACRAMMGDKGVGDDLQRWLTLPRRDDVFIAQCLSRVSLKRDFAIGYLIEELEKAKAQEKRQREIVTVLRDITVQDFGYLEATRSTQKAAAIKAWAHWWSQGSPTIKPR